MAQRTQWHTRVLSPEEAVRAVPLLASSLSTCTEFRWVTGADDGRVGSGGRLDAYVEWMMRYSVEMALRVGGECVGVFGPGFAGGASPAAVSVSFPPGADNGDRAHARAVRSELGMPPPWLPARGYDAGAQGRHRAMAAAAGEIHSRATGGRPHWYLSVLGTAPAAQGTGAGAMLVGRLAHLAAASGTALFLETSGPTNPGWYTRRGMRVNERLRIAGSEGSAFHDHGGFAAMIIDPPPPAKL